MKRQVALDTETTGKSDDGTPGDHRIVEVGCVEIIDRKITGRTLRLFVNPERKVDEEAFRVHGISDEFLKDKPKFAEVASELIDFIRGSELLIHNAKFDVGFMDKEWMLLNMDETTKDIASVVDTVSLAMKLCPGHQVNLDNLCNIYDVDRSARTIHGALLDAQILAEVYLAMTGGQSALAFSEDTSVSNARFVRPAGAKLPLMNVEMELAAAHIDKMISLSQGKCMVKSSDPAVPSKAGSNWSDEYEMDLLVKGEEESKGSFKSRLGAQKEEMKNRLLDPQMQKMLALHKEKELAIYNEWKDRVLGIKK